MESGGKVKRIFNLGTIRKRLISFT